MQVGQLTSALQERGATVAELEQQVADLAAELEAARSSTTAKDSELQAAQSRAAAQEEQVESLKKEVAAAQLARAADIQSHVELLQVGEATVCSLRGSCPADSMAGSWHSFHCPAPKLKARSSYTFAYILYDGLPLLLQTLQEEVSALKDTASKKDREGRELREAVQQLSADLQVW